MLRPSRTSADPPPAGADAPACEISIVMPCLDEARTVGTCVAKARDFLARAGVSGEILVVDNGSSDDSVEVARAAGARVVLAAARGYGSALLEGIRAARAPYVVIGDADDSYDFREIGPLLERLRSGCDLVLGNRFRGGIRAGAMPFLHRYVGNPVLTLLARLFFDARCGDVYCGLRGFRKSAIESLALQSPGMEFALEMVVKSSLAGLRVEEVPVTLSPDGRDREPHLKTWSDGRRSLRLYLLCAPRWVFLFPGIALALAGTLGLLLIELRAGRIGPVRFDVHTMIYCATAIPIGVQAILFALVSRILAGRSGLLPRSERLERGVARFRLEHGLAVALAFLGGGLAATVHAIDTWRRQSFGDLDPFQMQRVVIPAALALALGCQIAFSSLHVTMLKHYWDARPGPPGRRDA